MKTVEQYVYELNSPARVILIEKDNGDILSQIWKSPMIIKNQLPFFLFDIISSNNPMIQLANSIFVFLQREFKWQDPAGQTVIYQGPKIPEASQQVDKFVEECCHNSSFMIQLLFAICAGFPHTLLFGIHLPDNFFENTSSRQMFLSFLKEMSAQKVDLRFYVSSGKARAELEELIKSTKKGDVVQL